MKSSELSIEQVTEALAALEPIFHRPEFGTSRADFEAMVAPEFWEIGASGTRYSKAFVFDTLMSWNQSPWIGTLRLIPGARRARLLTD